MPNNFQKIFSAATKPVIAMIHVKALPGTPNNNTSVKAIVEHALMEAKIYQQAGVDAIALENMHDIPYLKRNVGHEISSAMAIVAYEVKKVTDLPCGIQILAGANQAALATAHAAGLDFIRAEGFVFGHMADEGLMDSDAGELLRYRKMIGAEQVAIFTDIKKKHSSHSITADTSIIETAKAAAFFKSDGLIITGQATGEAALVDELTEVRAGVDLPILIGSGINIDNLATYLPICDGMIVGSYFKEKGHWMQPVNKEKVIEFMKKVKNLSKEYESHQPI